ncbi:MULTISPECIES: branched-chain amino acid ABC transporter permease [unclassified Pusillimonas]|uniref:branched-chain amino acid ABC transporter permease n=1 Tax=unclassified Pusillimonas TaxID=2640016 RepID=UPI000B9D49E9|nr:MULTISPECIES: branched-chain amino acid ABC transporter permease [unclassified Pusillimonas]OXR48733.1 branched-chain amino acid ABC transporter permease [Pusillimonas sp. T2]ROT44054.1 branched-chain amino acid ABC transporter permease [Pusillimonas sp. NJUB218]
MIGNFIQVANALSFSALLFIVASGFTLIFGLLRVVNLAHGSLYLIGGYVGMVVAVATGSFFLAFVVAAFAIAVVGYGLDRWLLERVKDTELKQVLLTLGFAMVLNDLALVLWGGDTRTIPLPDMLLGAVRMGPFFYPKYRMMVIVAGIVIFVALWFIYNRTKLGALIRAGVDDREMVQAMGINIRRLFVLTFMLGSALAGLAGTLGGAFLTLYPGADAEILVFALAIVIIGGRGSLAGAAVGSLLVGFLANFGQIWFPEFSYFIIFGPMAVLLAFRPLGLFGRA